MGFLLEKNSKFDKNTDLFVEILQEQWVLHG